MALAQELGVAALLDSATWIASRDRDTALGYSPEDLNRFNRDAIELIASVRDEADDLLQLTRRNRTTHLDVRKYSFLLIVDYASKNK